MTTHLKTKKGYRLGACGAVVTNREYFVTENPSCPGCLRVRARTKTEEDVTPVVEESPLMPCPFCGEAKELRVNFGLFHEVVVCCVPCGTKGPIFKAARDDQRRPFSADARKVWDAIGDAAAAKAREAWNKRAASLCDCGKPKTEGVCTGNCDKDD